MSTHQHILNELFLHFDKMKVIIDKYPNAIKILENEETGCCLDVNLDLIEIHPEEKHLVQE